jgi:hypothetical protein
MELNEIINDSKFNEFLQGKIDDYNERPVLPIGQRYKRTPFDGLKEEGKFSIGSIRAEFTLIENRETSLSRSKRDAITSIVFEAARETIKFRADEEKEVREASEASKEETTRALRAGLIEDIDHETLRENAERGAANVKTKRNGSKKEPDHERE